VKPYLANDVDDTNDNKAVTILTSLGTVDFC